MLFGEKMGFLSNCVFENFFIGFEKINASNLFLIKSL